MAECYRIVQKSPSHPEFERALEFSDVDGEPVVYTQASMRRLLSTLAVWSLLIHASGVLQFAHVAIDHRSPVPANCSACDAPTDCQPGVPADDTSPRSEDRDCSVCHYLASLTVMATPPVTFDSMRVRAGQADVVPAQPIESAEFSPRRSRAPPQII